MKIIVDEWKIFWFVVGEIRHIHHHPKNNCEGAECPTKDVEEPLPAVRVEVRRGHFCLTVVSLYKSSG